MSSQVIDRDALAPPKPRQAKRSRNRLALGGAALALLLGAAWYGHDWWVKGRFIESTDDAYVGGDVTPISPHVAGFVGRILVADNQRVRSGQLLIRLDNRDFQAAFVRAGAVLQQREAALADLGAKSRLQHSIIRQARATLLAADAQAGFTQADAARYRSMARAEAVSRQDAQKAQAAAAGASATVLAAEAGLEAARRQLAVLDAETRQARASAVAAQADLRSAQLALGYTEIRSPIDGYVGDRAAQRGAYVTAGADLLSIIPAQGLWIDANFKEDEIARMRPGQPASVTADVLPGRVLHGHVASLAPATGAVFSVIPPQNATGNFTKIVQRVPVRIELDAGDGQFGLLRPGLSATVSVDTQNGR